MSEIVGMKLSSGETILGSIIDEGEVQTVLANPITVKYLWDDVPPTIYATPSCPLAYGETAMSVVRSHIVCLFRPCETLLEYYHNSLENILNADDEEETLEDLEVPPVMTANNDGTVH
jgi:hypothetical protein